MKTIKNKMTWKGTAGKVIDGESETVQGDTLPLHMILVRYSNGIDVPRGAAMYGDVEDDEHESSDYNQVVNADLIEKEEMALDRIALIEQIKLHKEQKEKAKSEKIKNEPPSHVE